MTFRLNKTIFPAFLLSACASVVHSAVLFEDGFESGGVSHTANGIRWSAGGKNTSVTSTRAKTGNNSLQFVFEAKGKGQDAFAEHRIQLGGRYTELWIRYDLYLPSNYHHRSDGASNNKFFAIFNNSYSPGFQVNFSMNAVNDGGSMADIRYYSNGSEQSNSAYPRKQIFGASDRGKWHNILMHFKVPSSLSSKDGVMKLWKNGESLISVDNLNSNGTQGLNYMDEAYILGWANSGFDQQTVLNVDNVAIANSPLSPSSGGIVDEPAPQEQSAPTPPQLSAGR